MNDMPASTTLIPVFAMPIRTTSTRYSDLAAPALPSVFSIASAADADHRGPTMSPADLMMPGATPLLAARRRPSSYWPAWSRAWSGWGCHHFHGLLADHGARASRRAAGGAIAGHQPVAGSARRDLRPDLAPHRRHAGGRLRRHAGGRLVAGRAIRRLGRRMPGRRAGPVRGLGPVRFATLHSHAARGALGLAVGAATDWSPQPPACS